MLVRRPDGVPPEDIQANNGLEAPKKGTGTSHITEGIPHAPTPSTASLFDEIQRSELPLLLDFLSAFWSHQAATVGDGPIARRDADLVLSAMADEHLSHSGMALEKLLTDVQGLLERYVVKTSHPLFLGYVTPPSLYIAVLGEALKALVNQNVMFASLSPLGTALEISVIRWLGEIVGYSMCGGILTSGGSAANAYALAVARRKKLGAAVIEKGNYATPGQGLRIYCSTETHHSIDKAAAHLGIGTGNVVRISVDENHRIKINELYERIKTDLKRGDQPIAIVGNAGTLHCCAFDDLQSLRKVANEFDIWLHADAAYGGFLRLATPAPEGSAHLNVVDSITLDPHKLLFVPFDCGSLLVRDPQHLLDCFGAEGEYLQPKTPPRLKDFANFGMQLGRSMRALPVWLTLKRFGMDAFAQEYSRLLGLAQHLRGRILDDPRFGLLGPVPGTAVCFRWRDNRNNRYINLDALNAQLLEQIIRASIGYVTKVELSGKAGLRVCMTNYRTRAEHLDSLLAQIALLAAGGQEMED